MDFSTDMLEMYITYIYSLSPQIQTQDMVRVYSQNACPTW